MNGIQREIQKKEWANTPNLVCFAIAANRLIVYNVQNVR